MQIRKFLLIYAACLFVMPAIADVLSLDDSLRATYTACVGIDDELADLKKMAGINTAITGVGTGLGVGATAVGIVKANKDKALDNLDVKLQKLRDLESNNRITYSTQSESEQFQQDFEKSYTSAITEIERLEKEKQKLNEQSKKLGNWRTGLMAGNTVTNVAGAVIAAKNRVDDDLQAQIDNCKAAVKELQNSIIQAKLEGTDTSEAQAIYDACREYDFVDISKINKRAKGATVSSIVGATTGLTGTITSAAANTDKIRNDDTDAGKQKEKNLNTASNVLAGTSTVASATATVFNAMQIKAIKDVAIVASNCTEVLK